MEEKSVMAQYNHTAIESKWRENWEKNPINVNDVYPNPTARCFKLLGLPKWPWALS